MIKSLSQTKEGLADTITISASPGTYSLGPNVTIDNVTIGSNYPNTISAGGYTISPGYGAVPNVNTTIGGPFTFSAGTNTAPWFTQSPTSAKIKLDGEDADIVINGSSLVDAINSIRDRLNCLQINPELETEWEELRALGDQYRKLEKQIIEKQATWDRLKAMPPPAID
jgi:hypothetical protein